MLATMFRFGRGRWTIALEDGWRGEIEDGTACIAREGGDGVLLISAADKEDGTLAREDLEALARGECPGDASVGDCEFGDFRGLHAMYTDSDASVRWHRWYLGYGSLALFVSYTVALDVEGDEDEAVMTMLRTLQARGESWQ